MVLAIVLRRKGHKSCAKVASVLDKGVAVEIADVIEALVPLVHLSLRGQPLKGSAGALS